MRKADNQLDVPRAADSAAPVQPTVHHLQPPDPRVVAAALHAIGHAANESDLRAVRAGG